MLAEDTGKIDWRQGYDYDLMGLNFGCFDFIVTPSLEYVFLECNPNGQWLWVELATEQRISEAIAEFLAQFK